MDLVYFLIVVVLVVRVWAVDFTDDPQLPLLMSLISTLRWSGR